MSYVPPHLRKSKSADTPIPVQGEFPSLGVAKTKSQFIPKRSFASLATEWSEESEHQKQKEEFRKEVEAREVRRHEAAVRNIVTFRNSSFHDQTYTEETEDVEQHTDEWTTVNHIKPKRELSDEERLNRELAKEEEEKRMKEEDTMWVYNTHDDFDYRDRRGT